MTDVTFSNLAARPEFIGTVADRMWHAWWREAGEPLATLLGHLREFKTDAVPLGVVAHRGDDFVGSAILIDSDVEERPQYTPWLAALWVEPEERMQGMGEALSKRIVDEARALGFDRIYLCAVPEKSAYYARRGWTEVERGVGPHNLAIFIRHLDAEGAGKVL
ncbi:MULTISPECIES: GNAT family N-acetyltransferase [Kaistia]|uniref:GNAT family N-acetyltransferase n=1 Tax=Kaistia nematophila TaxID=2994654 RepID=A0A9X3IMC6_9HYPH|nr:GNAT family N-acetyltransferase [Hyphomicrobiales bacterium]MCX5569750.1 GNAT family N-acetyltransferase [Kaistia nematophila]